MKVHKLRSLPLLTGSFVGPQASRAILALLALRDVSTGSVRASTDGAHIAVCSLTLQVTLTIRRLERDSPAGT